MQVKKLAQRVAVAAGSLIATGAAMADAGSGPDTSAITGAATTVAGIGTAVFAVYVGIKVFKWARSAL